MKAIHLKTLTSVGLMLAALIHVSVGGTDTEDIHLQEPHDDLGRASPTVVQVAADEDNQADCAQRAPDGNDPRAFFYGCVWFDNNANDYMDTGEEGMPRVKVSLWLMDRDVEIKDRTTDKDGYFEIPLKEFRRRVDREYYLHFEMKDKKKEVYVFFDGSDSQVDDLGKSEDVTIPANTTTGGRYKTYAGVRAKTAVFYGTMWYDNNANDLMDEDEERVLRNVLYLWRADTPDERILKKKTGKSSGTYEISLDQVALGSTYYVAFRLPHGYMFVMTGDSDVDKDGRGMQTSVELGKRYKVNAGIRPIGASFYGKVWYDDDGGGIIDKRELEIPGVEVSLFRKPSDRPFVKKTYTVDDGTYELNLKNIHPELTYYLRFRTQFNKDYFLDHVGDSDVDANGRTNRMSLESQKRYELNAGAVLTCPPIRVGSFEQAISELSGFTQNILISIQALYQYRITSQYSSEATIVLDEEEAIEEITDILELSTTGAFDPEEYKNYLRDLHVIEQCDMLLRVGYFSGGPLIPSRAVASQEGDLKFEPVIDMFPIVPDLTAPLPDPDIPLDAAESEGTRALQGLFPKTFEVTKEWAFNAGWGSKVECFLGVQVITNDLCTGEFNSTFASNSAFPVDVKPLSAVPPVTTWNQANPNCPGKVMQCGKATFPFTVTMEIILVAFPAQLVTRTYTIEAWVCTNGARSLDL